MIILVQFGINEHLYIFQTTNCTHLTGSCNIVSLWKIFSCLFIQISLEIMWSTVLIFVDFFYSDMRNSNKYPDNHSVLSSRFDFFSPTTVLNFTIKVNVKNYRRFDRSKVILKLKSKIVCALIYAIDYKNANEVLRYSETLNSFKTRLKTYLFLKLLLTYSKILILFL